MLQLEPLIGHRGACAYAPENTIAAFNKAVELGCRFIEFDVMLSQDGEAFVFHDETLNRTTNRKGYFGETSAETLRQLDAGSWFSKRFKNEPIPSLSCVLQWLQTSDVQANIEIKPFPGTTEQTTIAVLTHLTRYWPPSKPWPLLSSFEWDALRLCRSISPEVPLGLLMDKWNSDWLKIARELQCYSVHLNRKILSKEKVQMIKQEHYKVCAYTVNRRRQAKKLFDWGVDAVFSDYPDLLN